MAQKLPSTATNQHTTSQHFAGFEKRLYAIAIDMLFIVFIAVLVGAYQNSILLLLLQAAYFSFCWSYIHGVTLGNRIMHIQVVSLSGHPLTLKQSLLRFVGFFLSEVVLFLGFLWIFWDKKRQGWHDKLAKTIVIKT
jgi:uncharacterized RDD family membrane protein YckC